MDTKNPPKTPDRGQTPGRIPRPEQDDPRPAPRTPPDDRGERDREGRIERDPSRRDPTSGKRHDQVRETDTPAEERDAVSDQARELPGRPNRQPDGPVGDGS